MKSSNLFSFFIIVVILSVIILSNGNLVFAEDEILIASWNLQNFGATRADNDFNLGNMTAIFDATASIRRQQGNA